MRSQRRGDLQRQISALERSGQLRYTGSQKRNAADTLEPVPYFIIPAQSVQSVGALVVSFVHLNRHGMIAADTPVAYGIAERPTEPVIDGSEIRLREAHVLAEDRALRTGVHTPFGRSSAELYVATNVAEDGNAATYVPDRIAHLHALAELVVSDNVLDMVPQVVYELNLGIKSLEVYLANLERA